MPRYAHGCMDELRSSSDEVLKFILCLAALPAEIKSSPKSTSRKTNTGAFASEFKRTARALGRGSARASGHARADRTHMRCPTALIALGARELVLLH